MRWADLDLHGHVNNVVYVDYLQEARVDMLRTRGPAPTGDLAEGVVVARHEVSYLAPLAFGFEPVTIESWITDIGAATFTIAYEIFHLRDGERRVHARASTVLTPFVFAEERPRRLTAAERESLAVFLEPDEPSGPRRRLPRARPEAVAHFPVQVRFSDVDVYGHVNNVTYFEYLQESRIALTAQLWEGLAPRPLVVAQTDVDYVRPILFRPEPYDAWSWVTRVGSRSATIDSVIADGDQPLARSRVTMVFYDLSVGRSVEPGESYLAPLRSLMTT